MQEKREVIVIEATKPFITNDLKSNKKLRVCAYARVSTNQLDQINSYNAQIEEYSSRIKENKDWIFAGLYSDEGISGTSVHNRTGFNKMIKDAKDGLIDKILVKSISRFSRNTVDALSIIRDLRNYNVEVFFEKENLSSLDSKVDFHLTIFSSIAQEESRNISENINCGIRKRFKEGKVRVDTNRFLGFDKDEKGNLIINPEQAETVQYIFMLYLLGESYVGIANTLTEQGYKNGAGKVKWSDAGISKILKNEKYCGDLLLQKTVSVDYLTKRSITNNGEVPKYYIPDNHPAIVSRELFDTVNTLIKSKLRDTGHAPFRTKYPLSGLVYCSVCGQKLLRNHYRSKHKTRIVLTCKNGGDNVGCPVMPIDNDSLYILTDRVMSVMNYTRKDAINRLLDGIGLTYDENYYYKKIGDLEKENIDKELEIKNLIDFRLSSDVFTDDEYIATIYKSHKKRIELNNIKIESLKNDLATKIAGNSRLKYLKDYLSSEKLLYKQQVNDFMQNIIVISQYEVVFVQCI